MSDNSYQHMSVRWHTFGIVPYSVQPYTQSYQEASVCCSIRPITERSLPHTQCISRHLPYIRRHLSLLQVWMCKRRRLGRTPPRTDRSTSSLRRSVSSRRPCSGP
eukprot:XP_001707365.1 Hypothetical protein GL50803_34398 [Giardia lamblia ATCC 50803]